MCSKKILIYIFQPNTLIWLCLANFVCLIGFYSIILMLMESNDPLDYWDRIAYDELQKLMDPRLLSVEQMTKSLLELQKNSSSANHNSSLPNNDTFKCPQHHKNLQNSMSHHNNVKHTQRLLIIIPYRNRKEQLGILIPKLIELLHNQKRVCYKIVVVEQYGSDRFNKGSLMNAAFIEAMQRWKFGCVMFHDVDLIPENLEIPYHCSAFPKHVSVAVNSLFYKLPYESLVGGVLAMSTYHFLMLNGYSNLYWDWGAEDDDIYNRITVTKLPLLRPNASIARFSMLKHKDRPKAPLYLRHKLLYLSQARYRLDGLNSLTYFLISKSTNIHFTHLLVDIGKSPF